MDHLFPYPKMGSSWLEILHDPLTRKLLGFDAVHAEKTPFLTGVSSRLKFLLSDTSKHLSFLKIGYTALEAFLQANCTGPPLEFNPEEPIFPDAYRDDVSAIKQEMLDSLAVDGNAVYHLTPHIELFWLAKLVMANSSLAEPGFNGRRARFRVNHWHQKLLSEKSDTLQDLIYADADILEHQLHSRLNFGGATAEEHFVEFLIERAQLRVFYGDDEKAREDLARASQTRNFQFALTGALGKRTKFQVNDLSQLVVLAKSRDHEPESYSSRKSSRADPSSRRSSKVDVHRTPPQSPSGPPDSAPVALRPALPSAPTSPVHEHKVSPLAAAPVQPENVQLNDDTLLEHIKFKEQPRFDPEMTQVSDESKLPPRLTELDPSNQPILFPMDSIILLATASSISNTSPSDGLTREETLPYALRVLDGGSSNWQVYTQALLVRSRIEGYKSRTVERGLLQLQALVDQVIAETTQVQGKPTAEANTEASSTPSTFLPKAKDSESASVAERLRYVYQLSPPLRWELEAELAQRWTSMGGLKTALEIYERLQMQAEVALCLAATDREKEAQDLIHRLVFADPSADVGSEKISPTAPSDTPRLLCILGDITSHAPYYQLAWTHSRNTYSRAQRSLGRHYMRARDYPAAANAYQLALSRGKLDHATWFSLGCVQIELLDFQSAANSFQRCVVLDDRDAEAWSNLAISLLRLPEPDANTDDDPSPTPRADSFSGPRPPPPDDDPESFAGPPDPHRNKHMALRALRRAATLKRDDARIWDNYLTVAASIPPSGGTPWAEIIQAMQRVIELRGKKEGEGAVDLKIFNVLVQYVMAEFTYPTTEVVEGDETPKPTIADTPESKDDSEPEPPFSMSSTTATTTSNNTLPFLPRALLTLADKHISPLVTSSVPLYSLLAQLALWRRRPAESLSLHEKAWRAVTSKPGVYESEAGWKEVVDATLNLVDAYERLGEMTRERTGGLVEEKWRFKARTAVRGVLGRGKDVGEGTEGWERLMTVVDRLK